MTRRFLLAFLSVLATASILSAQSNTTGQITGIVTDPSGAVVAGANLALTSSSGARREVTSDTAGVYAFPLLPPGVYRLEVKASGFKATVFEAVEARITESTQLDVRLQVGGGPGESVTVAADAVAVQTNNAAMGRVIGERAVSELPLATRNFTQILGLSTGAATYLPDNTSVGRNSQNISVNGARVTNNNYMINGVDTNSQGTNSAPSLSVPAPESLEEFKVQTSMYDASFGRSGGGSIQAVTRSGDNQYHGQLYEYLRNADLNANGPFLKAAGVNRPQLNRNVFGGTFGGPIKKDKTFFFGSYQGTREVNGASLINSLSINVRIAPGLTNDRSEKTLLNTFKPASAAGAAATSINPVALNLLNAKLPNGQYAIPTPGANGFYNGSTPSTYDENQFNSNIDHRFSDRNMISGKFFFFNAPQTLTLPSFLGGGPNLPGWGNKQINNGRIAVVQWTNILNPNLVHELRAGYSFLRVDAYPQEPINDSSVGITRANAGTFPGLPQISVVGGFTIGTSPTIDVKATAPAASLIDQWAWTHGKHTIRAGAELRRSDNNYVLNYYTRGTMSYLSFNDFLLGNTYVNVLATGLGNRSLRAYDYNFFVQDDWKISRNLTLNLGLRYELDLPPYDTRGRINTFDPGLYVPRNLVLAGVPYGPPVGGLLQAANVIPAYASSGIQKGSSDTLLKSNDPNNFAPRVGFAYSPLASDRLVIRGGYGIYYSRTSFQYVTLGVVAPPVFVLGSTVGAPASNPFPVVPPLSAFPTVVPGVNLSGNFFDPNIRTPYMQQWNYSTQYAINRSLLFEAGYVGTRGLNLFREININQPSLASVQHPVVNAVTGEVITTNTAANAQTRAPYQGVAVTGAFTQNQSSAQSSYHSLQTSLTQRFSKGVQFLVSYTWSHSIDNASGQGGGAGSGGVLNPGTVGETVAILGNQFDNRANRGVSDFDRTQRLVVSGTWQLPNAGKSPLAKALLHDWQLGLIVTSMSGLPIDVIDGGGGTLYYGANSLSRPSWASGATRDTAFSNVPAGYYFNPAAFTRAVVPAGQPIPSGGGQALAGATGTDLGNLGRNVLRGPGQNNTDFSIFKRFRFSERRSLEFRSEFFNLWNQVNLANPISDLNTVVSTGGALSATGQVLNGGNFGRIISTSSNPRLIQFALKLQF